MAVKLHRCPLMFLKIGAHPCHVVQSALDEQGIEYEVVKAPTMPRSRRKDVERISGQTALPVIELEDGTVYRAESADMAKRISAGQLGTTA